MHLSDGLGKYQKRIDSKRGHLQMAFYFVYNQPSTNHHIPKKEDQRYKDFFHNKHVEIEKKILSERWRS